MKPPPALAARFRDTGRKVTPQRYRIFEALHANVTHPTAESLWDDVRGDMPTISLKTVYQTLHELADLGELTALELGTGAARFDPNLDPHHHLVCDHCGQVSDLYADFAQVAVPVGETAGFTISSTEIVFRGTCSGCHQAQDHLGASTRTPMKEQ